MSGDEITLLFLRAKSVKNPLFIMKYMKNTAGKPLFAVASPKKIFKTAVLRNKARRRIYGAIRSSKMETLPFFSNYSVVFIPNIEAIKAPYKILVKTIEDICKDLIKT